MKCFAIALAASAALAVWAGSAPAASAETGSFQFAQGVAGAESRHVRLVAHSHPYRWHNGYWWWNRPSVGWCYWTGGYWRPYRASYAYRYYPRVYNYGYYGYPAYGYRSYYYPRYRYSYGYYPSYRYAYRRPYWGSYGYSPGYRGGVWVGGGGVRVGIGGIRIGVPF